MLIFKHEHDIAEKVLASRSLSYTQLVEKMDFSADNCEALLKYFNKTKASLNSTASINDEDLFFTRSILVTTNWNLNDDVFDRLETWAARHTPSHKPTNIEHNEKLCVGHMTDTWAIDLDGNLIDDNLVIDDLPNIYHLANGSVIYRGWEDSELKNRAENLIVEIENGKKCVSMECIFRGFDYALSKNNEFHIIARNEKTSFLTKHLRIYGGVGEYDGCKLGRILRNITFSGKGFVDKPANPQSIILNDKNIFDFKKAKSSFFVSAGVNITKNENLENKMSEVNEILKANNDELKAQVKDLTEKFSVLQSQANESGLKTLEQKIASLEKQVSDYKEVVEGLEKDKAALVEEKDKSESSVKDLQKQLDEAKASLETTKAEKVKADRVSKLVDAGVERELATKKVEIFKDLNDEQFESLAEDIIAAAKKDKDKNKDKEEMDAEASNSNDSSDAADVVESSEANENETELNTPSEDTQASLQSDLAKVIAANVFKSEVE